MPGHPARGRRCRVAPGGAGSMQVKHVLTRESDRLRRREDGQQRCANPRAMPSWLHPRQHDRGLCGWTGGGGCPGQPEVLGPL